MSLVLQEIESSELPLIDITKERKEKNFPKIDWATPLNLDPMNHDPLYRYSDGFKFEMRPTLYYLWEKTKSTPHFKPVFRSPPKDELIWREIKWTTKRETSWIVQTVGPMESGKSWFNISLAHFLRDWYLIWGLLSLKNPEDVNKLLIPRIFLTFDYRDTLKILYNPNAARRALIPVHSCFYPEEWNLNAFDISWVDIQQYDNKEVLPREADIIVQDERPRMRGLGSRSTMDNLNNIIETSRKKRINFLFASPTSLEDLSIINNMFEMFGRDFERYWSRVVIYDAISNALGIAHFPIYPDWDFFLIYEKLKDMQIEDRLKSGGTVAGVDMKKVQEDAQRIIDEWKKNVNMFGTRITKTTIEVIANLTLSSEPVSYIKMVSEVVYNHLRGLYGPELPFSFGIEEKEGGNATATMPTTVPSENTELVFTSEEEEPQIQSESIASPETDTNEKGAQQHPYNITPEQVAQLDEQADEKDIEFEKVEDLETFDFEIVSRDILLTEQMVRSKNINWKTIQLAYYYRIVLGLPTERVVHKLMKLGLSLSSKFIREQVRKRLSNEGYFAQISTSLKTKVGFKYEKWVAKNYWSKHPQVAKVRTYKTEGKSHQATPDIILTLKDGRKVAVAVKVKTSANKADPISFKPNGHWIPEWKAFLDGEVDLVVLDVWQVTFNRPFRKIVFPKELEDRITVRIDVCYDEDGNYIDTGEGIDFDKYTSIG